jgi:hypothetical protein
MVEETCRETYFTKKSRSEEDTETILCTSNLSIEISEQDKECESDYHLSSRIGIDFRIDEKNLCLSTGRY